MLPIFNPYLVIDQPCCSRTNLSSDRSPTQETLPSSLNSNLVVVNHSPTEFVLDFVNIMPGTCLLYTSPSPRDATLSRMPSST